MGADVVSIAERTDRAENRKAVVELLRRKLEEAERGEIVACAIAAVGPGGEMLHEASRGENLGSLLGALDILRHRLIVSAIDATQY